MTTTQLTSGTELGRYELLVPIAKGGMAQVWAGRLRGTRGFSKLVAIKTILPGGIDSERLEQMFLEEASLAAQIHHPNVVETLELGEHEGTLYLVMEWVEGESLDYVQRRAKERGGLPRDIAVQLMAQVCRGLHAAHELTGENAQLLGLVHRDISPQNVLVTYNGAAKLVDFGIAKATGRSSGLTDAGELKGKVAYMAPEQVKGQALDRRTDVFALGVVLYGLTTGKHPFRGAHPAETIRRICLEEPAPPAAFVADYPAQLSEVVMSALHKDPKQRLQSAEAMRTALQRAMPECFESSFETKLAQYIEGLVGDRARERRAALRLAQEAVAKSKSNESYSSLRAISIDRTAEKSSSSRSLAAATPRAPDASVVMAELPTGKPSRVRLALGAAAVLGAVASIALAASTWSSPAPSPAPFTNLTPAAQPAAAAVPVPASEPRLPASASAAPLASGALDAGVARHGSRQRSWPLPAPRIAAGRASATLAGSEPAPQRKQVKADAWDPSSFGSRQ